MANEHIHIKNTAARLTASSFGVLGGLGGVIHGIGEVLQGNVTPAGFFFSSWAEGPIAIYLDGDPALSLIPNLLITGLVTLFFSVATVLYSMALFREKNNGKLLLTLSGIMLLVGGGVGPPILVLLAGIAELGINSPYLWWQKHLHSHIQRVLAILWPWVFAVCVLNGVFLVIGHVIAVYFFAPVRAVIFQISFLFSVVSVVLSIITGMAYDVSNREKK